MWGMEGKRRREREKGRKGEGRRRGEEKRGGGERNKWRKKGGEGEKRNKRRGQKRLKQVYNPPRVIREYFYASLDVNLIPEV